MSATTEPEARYGDWQLFPEVFAWIRTFTPEQVAAAVARYSERQQFPPELLTAIRTRAPDLVPLREDLLAWLVDEAAWCMLRRLTCPRCEAPVGRQDGVLMPDWHIHLVWPWTTIVSGRVLDRTRSSPDLPVWEQPRRAARGKSPRPLTRHAPVRVPFPVENGYGETARLDTSGRVVLERPHPEPWRRDTEDPSIWFEVAAPTPCMVRCRCGLMVHITGRVPSDPPGCVGRFTSGGRHAVLADGPLARLTSAQGVEVPGGPRKFLVRYTSGRPSRRERRRGRHAGGTLP